jgi:predicted Zn-dependent protease with MMP-like domain
MSRLFASPRSKSDNCILHNSRHIDAMHDPDILTQIEQLAIQTVETFPPAFLAAARKVVVQVSNLPTQDMTKAVGLDDPMYLTGLYEGIPLTEKSVFDQPQGPDVVWLFSEPILAELQERGNISLEELVSHITTHEFAHHFGWSDDDIARIDRWWE